jgi:PfpI family intracellular protease
MPRGRGVSIFEEKYRMNGIATRGLRTGAALTLATTATMMAASAARGGSPWAGLNAMATALQPKRRRIRNRFDANATPLGWLALSGGLLAWGLAFEGAHEVTGRRNRFVAGALSALGGYAIDKFVLPARLVPNFRRAMGPAGTFAKYVALGLASAAATRARSGARKKLTGRRIAVLAADGFEQVELTLPVRALRAEGAKVDVLSLRPGKIVGMNLDVPGRRVRVAGTIAGADPDAYDGLLVPGGFISPDMLRQSRAARDFVRAIDVAGKPIAAICHGPWVLASAGLLRGRRVASWPGIRDDLVNAGAVHLDEPVVRDGNLVSSRGPQDLPAFTKAIVEHFSGRAAITERPPAPTTSSPQRDMPPLSALAGLALAPRISNARRIAGTVALLGLAGGAYFVGRFFRAI